jgi:hypothetical protein
MIDIMSSCLRLTCVLSFLMTACAARLDAAGDQECSSVMAWGRLELYERGSSGHLMQRFFDTKERSWSAWEAVGRERITSTPSALMTNGGTRLAVFFRGLDGKLWHLFRDQNSGWSAVIGLGSRELATAPNAVVAAGVLTVFARNSDGVLMKIYYDQDQTSWTDWMNVE